VWPELHDELELELAQLETFVEAFRLLLTKTRTRVPDTVETVALAAFLHSFYTSIENVFKRMELHTEGRLPEGPAWHSQLLGRMVTAGENRPAVISPELHEKLFDYLSFRHVFRHAYSFELQWKKMAPLVSESETTLNQLQMELNRFFAGLDSREDTKE
jgi:hypothetical protein